MKEKLLQDYLQKIIFKINIVLSQDDIDASFANIKERIDLPTHIEYQSVKKLNLFISVPFKVACSVAALLTISFFGLRYYNNQKQITIANSGESVKEVVMPDGSKITLRAASSITYRTEYIKNRDVILKGEALFEVTKDKVHPFTVETKLGKVTVLGTVFSVRAFPEETYTRTILKEGKVKFEDNDVTSTVVLKPGEEARLNEGDKSIKVNKVENMDRALAWQSHKFTFDNEKLSVIISVIAEAFNKKIEIRDKELSNQRFTLKLNRNETIIQVLDVLSEVAKFKYIQEKDNIVIVKQQKKAS